jgi:hypothetical protein
MLTKTNNLSSAREKPVSACGKDDLNPSMIPERKIHGFVPLRLCGFVQYGLDSPKFEYSP